MSENRQPMENTPEVSSTYQTGSTNPPKSHVGLVAVLLSLTIFICGLSTIFSLMRINLLQRLTIEVESQECTMAFAHQPEAMSADNVPAGLQVQGRTLDPFWQSYHDLPQGIYITEACGQPLRTGDVLTSFDHTPVTSWDTVNAILSEYEPGQAVPATVYRDGKHTNIFLIIYE